MDVSINKLQWAWLKYSKKSASQDVKHYDFTQTDAWTLNAMKAKEVLVLQCVQVSLKDTNWGCMIMAKMTIMLVMISIETTIIGHVYSLILVTKMLLLHPIVTLLSQLLDYSVTNVQIFASK